MERDEFPTAGRRPHPREDHDPSRTPGEPSHPVSPAPAADDAEDRATATGARDLDGPTRPLLPRPAGRTTDPADERTAELGRPAVEPTRPAVEPSRPAVEPSRPGVEPSRPGVEPSRPAAEPNRPADEETRELSRPPGPPDDVPITVELDPPGEAATRRIRPLMEGETSPDPVTATDPDRTATGPDRTATDPEPTATADSGGPGAPAVHDQDLKEPDGAPAKGRRLSSAGALIWVLLALFGFTLVVQLRSNDSDQGLATARQEDLVGILSDLEARDSRLQSEISALENSQRQLSSGFSGRQAALLEADKRADELGLLAGTLPGRGPGLHIALVRVKASAVLNAVQELRGAGGEVMQLSGAGGESVRIVASSYFVDAEGGGLLVDGVRLTGPYALDVIGSPSTMQTALQIPGGVVASVNSGGGSVTMEQRSMVEVAALRKATTLQYARPVS